MPSITKRSLPVDAYVGQRLKDRRRLVEVSQQALADATGITFQQVQKYEKGSNRISAGRLVQFAQILGVEPGYFFEGAPDVKGKGDASPEAAFRVSPECARLIRAVASITDPTVRQAVVASTEALAAELARAGGEPKSQPRGHKA